MLRHQNGTQLTFWEGYLKDGAFGYQRIYVSHAHGWTSGPAGALSKPRGINKWASCGFVVLQYRTVHTVPARACTIYISVKNVGEHFP